MYSGDPHLEIRYMKTILSGAPQLFYQTSQDWFASAEVREIWERVNNLNRLGKNIPSLYSMSEDAVLSDSARAMLKGDVPIFQAQEYKYATDELDYFRKGRVLFQCLAKSTTALTDNRPDVDAIAKEILQGLSGLSRVNAEECILSLGRDVEKTEKFYEDTMNKDVSETLIRTGIKALDEQGGMSRKGVYVIAANSGGGKSTFANQIGVNMTSFGESVGYVSLEMDKELCLYRTQSMLSGINQSKFLKKTLTPAERQHSDEVFKKFLSIRAASQTPIDYLCLGGQGFDIFKLLNFMEPLQYSVIVLDYANLLEMINKKEGLWWNLGEMIRLLKVYAERYNKCIIFLAQTDEESGKIKYAQAITHHADGIITWKCTKKEKELGLVTMEQPKMRRADPISYDMGLEFEFSRFVEVNGVGVAMTQQNIQQNKPQTRMTFE